MQITGANDVDIMLDEDGQPCAFELLDDEGVAQDIYKEFKEATKDLYDFC